MDIAPKTTREIRVAHLRLGGGRPLALIAGPCVIESEQQALAAAATLRRLTADAGIPFIYKSSYDKANRTSVNSYRGPGLTEGLRILEKIKRELQLPVLSDVHKEEEIEPAAAVLDVLQIPAFLCRQTDLVLKAARAGRAINVKKGQFMAPWDMKNVIQKIESTGNRDILLTERGFMLGYNNLVVDMRSLVHMSELGYPVVFDATHSVQQPGGQGDRSGGQRGMAPHLTRAAIATGCDALFLETHPDPDSAPSDGPNMIPFADLPRLLEQIKKVDALRLQLTAGPGK
jgi:2-dehydro-3-deoxyphosphooctonate aldolase (KDO 8-P synthase)